MKNLAKALLLLVFSFLSVNLVASPFPDGFDSFYDFIEGDVIFRDVNAKYSEIPLQFNYNTIKLTHSGSERREVHQALLGSNIKPSEVDMIMKELIEGINTSYSCDKVDIIECLVVPERYQFVFDYDKKLLLLHVNPSMLTKGTSADEQLVKYQDALDTNSALINHFTIYVDKTSDKNAEFRIDDEAILGLPYGYLHGDVQYYMNEDENELDVYKAAYHLDFDKYHLRAGQFRGYDELNATDFMRRHSTTNNLRERSVEVGTSNNLKIGKKNQQKYLTYFAPASGRIVVRNISTERIILNRNTEQGQQMLSYSELPYGIYNISVEVLVGGDTVAKEEFAVFNQANDTLATGEFDFSLGAGSMESSYRYKGAEDTTDEIMFLRGLSALKMTDYATLGAGVTGSDFGGIASLGTSLHLPYDSQLQLVYNHATTGEQYLNSNLYLGGFSVSYQKLMGHDEHNLAATMFGFGDYDRLFVGTGFPLTDNSYARLNTSYSKSEDPISQVDYETVNASAGVSIGLNEHVRLDMNVNYLDDLTSSEKKDFEEKLNGSISVNIALDPDLGVSYNSLASGNHNGVSHFRNSLNASRLIDSEEYSLSGQTSNTYSRVNDDYMSYTEGSLAGQYDNQVISGSAYTSYNSEQEYSLSGSLSNTQVVTNGKAYFTSEEADSYALVDMETNSTWLEQNDALKAHFTMRGNNSGDIRKHYIHSTEKLIRLKAYDNYEIDLNTDIADLHNSGDKFKTGYAYPGSVVSVNANVGIAKRIVAGFVDIFNQPVLNLTCQGEGCLEIASVVEGVYNMTVMDEYPYKFKSEDELICQLNVVGDSRVNYGNNICFPVLSLGQKSELKNDEGKKKVVQYLGDVFKDMDVSELIGSIQDSNITVYLSEGKYISSVFITYDDEALITAQQYGAIDSLLKFASTIDYLDVVSNRNEN